LDCFSNIYLNYLLLCNDGSKLKEEGRRKKEEGPSTTLRNREEGRRKKEKGRGGEGEK
jgi:hypothetical protein